MHYKLLTENNAKLAKGRDFGYYSVGLHLAPYKLSGFNVCPMASQGCAAACLNTAGNGNYPNVQKSRISKTRRFFEDRVNFLDDLCIDIFKAVKHAKSQGLKLSVRLNLTSDIRWETIKLPHINRRLWTYSLTCSSWITPKSPIVVTFE